MEEAEKTDIVTADNPFTPSQIETPAGLLATREMQEVQAQIMLAKRFPRDKFTATNDIIKACRRITLAKEAFYAYERGGTVITGPSIRMAEVLAQAWGNLDFGIFEISSDEESTNVMAFCWDMETNVRQKRLFRVPKERHTKKGIYKLTDPRDIYEQNANLGARRLRACILSIIPGDVVDIAVAECRKTLKDGGGEPIEDRIRKLVTAFSDVGVPKEAIEKKIGHSIGITTPDEFVDLQAIYKSIKENFASRFTFFELHGEPSETTKALTDRLLGESGD